MLGLLLIEQFWLLMVILFISFELSPPALFTPTSGRPGRSVWTADYTNGWRAGRGVGEKARLEAGLRRAAARGGLRGEREQAPPGLDL